MDGRFRDGGATSQHRRDFKQPGQRQHNRLQESPHRFSGPDLPDDSPGRGDDRTGQHAAHRVQMGHGVRQVATQRIFTTGNFQATGNPLDIAIEGDGFLQITMPDGTLGYTRDGTLKKDAQGRIVTSEGYFLEPQITIPQAATAVTISGEGIVTATIPGQATPQELGQIQLARFVNPAGLDSIGRNLFRENNASGPAVVSNPGTDGAGTIVQNYIEMANVQIVEEMVNMIVAQRAYEINAKAVTTSDEMLSTANQMKR